MRHRSRGNNSRSFFQSDMSSVTTNWDASPCRFFLQDTGRQEQAGKDSTGQPAGAPAPALEQQPPRGHCCRSSQFLLLLWCCRPDLKPLRSMCDPHVALLDLAGG